MSIGRVFADLLAPLRAAGSVEQGLARALPRVVALAGARAGGLAFRPPHGEPIVVVSGARGRAEGRMLGALAAGRARGFRRRAPRTSGDRDAVVLVPLGPPRRPAGRLALLGRHRTGPVLPSGFARELGVAIVQVWRAHRRALRITVLDDITRALVASASRDDAFRAFADGVARLVAFDSIGVSLVDPERGEFEILDVLARAAPRVGPRDERMRLDRTLLARVIASGAPVRVDDLTAPSVPEESRAAYAARGWRSALLAPLVTRGGVFGAVTLVAHRPRAFDDEDVEVVAELARPLASAVEQGRLLDESRRRAEELAALYATSRAITARLDAASVLERISRSVSALIGSTGCGIGLLDPEQGVLRNVAAHGYRTEEWRALVMPVGEGIMGRCAQSGQPIRVDDVRSDPRSARRDVDEREGIRSMLCVPLGVGGTLLGVISAFSTRPAVFSADHQRVLEAFAEQAAIALQNAQFFEESVRRARETHALLQAGRAVTASLDFDRTIRVIMEQARAVLGVESCGIMTRETATGELVSVASLDLPPEMVARVRVREGEGIAGLAVAERRCVQSADLYDDPRVRYPELPRASGFRSMLAAPLCVGDRAIGALVVFRRDVHRFSAAEEELLLALADQAAIALEHARLYERLEGMVAERTLELDRQKRFVEVVLEALPLGVFVLDAGLRVVRVNREGARAIQCDAGARCPFPEMVSPDKAGGIAAFLARAFATREIATIEEELTVAGETKIFRLAAAALDPAGGGAAHVVLLVEDITRAKHLERQMLLTERLTTAGRLAAGVAHELNNPLATIAGCAESLLARLKEGALANRPELSDFPGYLSLIEEEAYRCKEITSTLLQFVREPGGRREPTDLNALVVKTIELLSHQARFAAARFATDLDPALPLVTLNEGQLRQVFLGLASNALEAMEGRGRLGIRTRRTRAEVHVDFEDEGPGVPDEIAARIFDPFFTTKPPGQGTGLGLAIAQSIVADHGGRIELRRRPDGARGSVFRVVLPA